MAEVNPYQQPTTDEVVRARPEPKMEEPGDPVLAEAQRRLLRGMLGLVVVFGAMAAFVMGSLALAVADRYEPVPALVFSETVVGTMIGLLVFAVVGLAGMVWRLLKRRYPRRRVYAFGAAGWVMGLLCLGAIVRADMASDERSAEAACQSFTGGPGAAAAEQCKADHVRCQRLLRRQPDHGRLTSDAAAARMRACMESPRGGAGAR